VAPDADQRPGPSPANKCGHPEGGVGLSRGTGGMLFSLQSVSSVGHVEGRLPIAVYDSVVCDQGVMSLCPSFPGPPFPPGDRLLKFTVCKCLTGKPLPAGVRRTGETEPWVIAQCCRNGYHSDEHAGEAPDTVSNRFQLFPIDSTVCKRFQKQAPFLN